MMNKKMKGLMLIVTATFVMSGCELIDGTGKKLFPPVSVAKNVGTVATLNSLSVENFSISPAFDPATIEYTLVVTKATTPSVTVKAIGHEGATVSVSLNGDAAVEVTGPSYTTLITLNDTLDVNDVLVSVVSEDGLATGEYHIRVYYKGTSASLSGLSVTLTNGSPGAISSELNPAFASNGFAYDVGISWAATSVDITISTPEGSGMTVMVDGWTAESGNAVPITDLPAPGASRALNIVVTSQDLSNTNTYVVTVTRGGAPSTENRLKFLDRAVKVWGIWNDIDNWGDPDPTEVTLAVIWDYSSSDGGWLFSSISDYRVYTRPIDASIQGITVNGTTCDVVKVDNIDTYRCIISRSLFSEYDVVLPIVVTAESGDTKTYTLTIQN